MSPKISFPLLALFGVTRGLAGAGLGVLLASRIPAVHRRRVGLTLFGVGAASTIPLIVAVIRRSRQQEAADTARSQRGAYSPGAYEAEDAELLPNSRL